jgi:hypothetical protein
MRRNVILAVLLVATGLVGVRYAFAGQAPGAASDPDIPISHQDRVYSEPNSIRTPSLSPIPSTISSLAPSALAIRRLPVSVRSTRASCWCMAWGFRRIIAPSPLSQSARMR